MTRKIILLEDDVWLADSLSSALSDLASMKVVHSPDEIFSVMDKFWPDVIIGDVILGQKNLMVLLNEMVSYDDSRKIPIIILSSIAQQINPNDVREFGVIAVLDKVTITPKILRQTVRELVFDKVSEGHNRDDG